MVQPLVIVGAGPFGLAVAADARRHQVPFRIFGEPMGFWRTNMPAGMVLRSAGDWYLDPQDELTIERFLAETGRPAADVEPLPLGLYLQYTDWFADRLGLEVERRHVDRVEVDDDGAFHLQVSGLTTDEGAERVVSQAVVLAVGQRTFAYAPPELTALVPRGRWTHTCELVDFSSLRGRRCLVVGGRQSAYEWTALLLEAGAASVDLVHRHPAPAFAVADWAWATTLAAGLVDDPAWWRSLSETERQEVSARLWGEGRLKVEPWLEPRLHGGRYTVHAGRRVVATREQPDGSIRAELDDGTSVVADQIVLATGYRPDVSTVPMLADLLPRLGQTNGHLDLDDGFQTTVPGLYATGALAIGAFGPFFGFTLAARHAAAVLGAAVRRRLAAG